MITWCGVSKEVRRGGEDGGGEISARGLDCDGYRYTHIIQIPQ